MTDADGPTVHASAVRVGARAVLIGDDRVHLQASRGQLVVRPARELAGLIEVRGLGIRRCAFADEAIVGLIVDLSAHDAERLPPPEALLTEISGVQIPRVPVAAGATPFPMIVAALTTSASSSSNTVSADCSKGFGNHIRPTIATE